MSEEDTADAIGAFADAALAAKRLGFDAVELHGAHGYLIDQFFWEGTDRREDAYGGKDLPGRARFAADIVHAVRTFGRTRTSDRAADQPVEAAGL